MSNPDFWVIQGNVIERGIMPIAVFSWIFLVILAVIVAVWFKRRYGLWHRGKPENRGEQPWLRLFTMLLVGVVNYRIIRRRELYPGLMHFCLAFGTILLLGGKIVRLFSVFTGIGESVLPVYLWASFVSEVGGGLIIIGALLAIIRRYFLKPDRLDTKPEDNLVYLWAGLLVLTGFMIKAYRVAIGGEFTADDWVFWSPIGGALANLFLVFGEVTYDEILATHRAWIHAIPAAAFLAYIWVNRSRLQHIVLSALNIYHRRFTAKQALRAIDFEEEEDFGAATIEKFTWKQLLDLDACTRCGRCQDACPTYNSGKVLSPKQMIQDLKDHLYEVYPFPFVAQGEDARRDMITEVVTEEAIWDCTSCRACMEACPVYIEHIDKIIDMRRNLTMERSAMPESAKDALKCLSTRWHPFRGTMQGRTDWADGLDVPVLADDNDVEFLYWVGCTAALEERNMKVAQAFAKIMQAAGIKFAILGDEEMCCGDPARRMGDEYLYQTLVAQNVEIMKGYEVKKIVTACPHCFNNLKFEYPQFEGELEVIHHTQFINQLIKDGRINPGKIDLSRFTFHDSCYLGRYNDIYSEPREVLDTIANGERVELGRCLNNSFCCGGGAGHMWMEEDPNTRISNFRIDEVIASDSTTLATACPYCLVMFEDAIKAREAEETLRAVDLAELVAQAIAPAPVETPEATPDDTPEATPDDTPEAPAEPAADDTKADA